jgi:hypothetical protein
MGKQASTTNVSIISELRNVNANWLNHVENIVDVSHLAWLHDEGREECDQRHEEIFRGAITLTARKLRFIRQDIAIVDTDCGVFGAVVQPPGVQAGADRALRTCLLLVLVEQGGSWWIAAYHNVWQATVRYETARRALTTSDH